MVILDQFRCKPFFGLFLKKHLIVNDIKQYSHRYWLNFLFIYKKTKNKKTNKLKIMRWNEKNKYK